MSSPVVTAQASGPGADGAATSVPGVGGVNGSIRRHLWVSGRVQGVGFRASCAYQAERSGLTGWVGNLPDGRVEAVLEGPAGAVDAVTAWCRQGPRGALVVDVCLVDEELPAGAGEAEGFAVR
jgi:acylphosphatase